MQFKDFLKFRLLDRIPPDIFLPQGFHLVGHVVLLQLNPDAMEYAKTIGETVLEFDYRIKSVAIRTGPTGGVIRTPNYTLVAGSPDTVDSKDPRGAIEERCGGKLWAVSSENGRRGYPVTYF